MDFADGFRIGLPFLLPIDPGYYARVQLVDNVSWLSGAHLFKAGVEYNRTSVEQQFIGFANSRYIFDSVDGFMGFATHGSSYVTCSDGSTSTMGACPAGASVTGPVLLYLQSATVPGVPADELGLQSMTTNELAFLLQDTWKPSDRLTLNMGVRWEGAWHPNVFIRPEETVYAPYLSDPRFPSDGTIPDDLDNVQPLPEQRRCGGAGAGARHRRADRVVRGRALPARHPGRRPEPQAAAHLVLRGGGDPRAQLRRDRERLLAARTHRRPLPLRGSERTRRAGASTR